MRKRWFFLSICFIILSCNSENNRDFESYLFKLNCSELIKIRDDSDDDIEERDDSDDDIEERDNEEEKKQI